MFIEETAAPNFIGNDLIEGGGVQVSALLDDRYLRMTSGGAITPPGVSGGQIFEKVLR